MQTRTNAKLPTMRESHGLVCSVNSSQPPTAKIRLNRCNILNATSPERLTAVSETTRKFRDIFSDSVPEKGPRTNISVRRNAFGPLKIYNIPRVRKICIRHARFSVIKVELFSPSKIEK